MDSLTGRNKMRSTRLGFLHQYSMPFTTLKPFRNPNIVAYKESFFEDQTQSLCIVMDYADDGDLDQKISYYKQSKSLMPESEIWHYFVQMVRGL